MSRKQLRPSLRVEPVEARDVPSGFGSVFEGGGVVLGGGGVYDPGPFYPAAAITFDSGAITVRGTEDADVIRIDTPPPIATQGLVFDPGDVVWWEQIRVRVTDAAGNLRYDAAGQPLQRFFAPGQVFVVNVEALGGNDRVVNATGKTTNVQGGPGNDTLQGGGGLDFLNGEGGNDSILGGGGDDALNGGADQDVVFGEAGKDLVDGAAGDDSLEGGAGNDAVFGGAGKDTLNGGFGDDEVVGGDGFSDVDDADVLAGGAGNDRLHGDAGNDILFGGDGNDGLYAGAGNDVVFGEWGNDGLYGGTGKDTLIGGSGVDRFLKLARTDTSANIRDRVTGESLTTFKDTTGQQTVARPGPDLRYAPKAWTDAEVAAVDAGLGWLHDETGNTRLLRLKSGGNLTFVRYGNYVPYDATDGTDDAAEGAANNEGAGFEAFNFNTGTVAFVKVSTTNPDEARKLVVHELAHNWDNENARWAHWRGLSGWVKSNVALPGQVLSHDGQWVYNETAKFARDYGKTNPFEDFATAFEAYYKLKTGTLSPQQQADLAPKLNFIGLFVGSLV